MNPSSDHFKTDARGNEYAGDHLLIELWDAHGLTDATLIENTLAAAARAADATVLHAHYHSFGVGQGISGVAVLAESHISIHTWPERGYAAIDVFMCGDCDPHLTLAAIEQGFRPGRIEARHVRRGVEPAADIQSVA